MKSISEELNLNNQKILLRLDLNVPLVDNKITDTTRIDKILPTLKFLISQNTKIIIISHVGRPKGQVVNELSLRPICQDLEIKLNQNIKLITKDIKEIASKDLFNNDDEKIVMLENIRFYPDEEKNNSHFARQLANLGIKFLIILILVETFEPPIIQVIGFLISEVIFFKALTSKLICNPE